jgi:tRNA (uracil-5-)-methyltransferase TRM9
MRFKCVLNQLCSIFIVFDDEHMVFFHETIPRPFIIYGVMPAASVETILLDINRKFYQFHAASFSSTRRRLQPGVRRLLDELPPGGKWLDLGCGNGTLAAAWAQRSATLDAATFTGLDISPGLLEDARCSARQWQAENPHSNIELSFFQADLAEERWAQAFAPAGLDGVCAFAVLHHLPGRQRRERLLKKVHSLLRPEGWFAHSEWQFQHSERLMARRLPWESIGMDSSLLEEGDTLLDWRHQLPPGSSESALRYVHLFSREELAQLATAGGFEVVNEFESDGKEGRLALYQVWRAL